MISPFVPPCRLQAVVDLFLECTSSNPQARPTAQQLVQRLSQLN